MHIYTKWMMLGCILFISSHGYSQSKSKEPSLIVKTNLLNLIAKNPSISIEKIINKKYGLELSVMTGSFNDENVVSYMYNGFLLRGKNYLSRIRRGASSPYVGIYTGYLKRVYSSSTWYFANGLLAIPSKEINAGSIRTGLTLGELIHFKNGIVIDAQASVGYGRYIITKKSIIGDRPGYLDTQLWLSVGYAF